MCLHVQTTPITGLKPITLMVNTQTQHSSATAALAIAVHFARVAINMRSQTNERLQWLEKPSHLECGTMD